MLNLKVCVECQAAKSLMLNINLPEALLNKVNEYFQCSDCDDTYKRELKNEKRRVYYRENKDRVIEKAHCNRVRRMALIALPTNKFIINGMDRILNFKGMELYWQVVNDFMVSFHDRYAGL